jgi:alpha-tubulin suppressor-like RCC1 family protein
MPSAAAVAPTAPAHIAAGDFHSCALRGDGTVRCWGRNKEGQLGDGTTENRATPTAVAGVDHAVQIACGANATCALSGDGSVRCWGGGKAWGDGQMRTGVPPTVVAGLKDVVQIDGGGLLLCALTRAGSVKCWGNEGDAVAKGASAPPDTGAAEVSAAEAHACARMGDGSARCWGDSPWNGVGGPSLARPRLTGAVQITTGDAMACVLTDAKLVKCWGRNDQGELGREPDNDWHAEPLEVPLGSIAPVRSVAAGEAHVCAVSQEGALDCWGSNGDGELGRGSQGPPERPGPVSGLRGVVEVAAGADHACARTGDGAVWCWGSNAHGQLGDGATERRTVPAKVAW